MSLFPTSGYLTNALSKDDRPVNLQFVQDYEDIFIKVKEWGAFERSDIDRNGLRIYVDGTVPDFVAKFKQELDSKPGLDPDVCCFLDYCFDADGSW
jgi:hypothetical protein